MWLAGRERLEVETARQRQDEAGHARGMEPYPKWGGTLLKGFPLKSALITIIITSITVTDSDACSRPTMLQALC